MKNLMQFVHPSHDFLPEQKTSIKIQIDNILDLGWKKEDIILATNFPYEYNGVKSLLASNDNYCPDISPCASIINVIVELFERKLIQKGELYWYHDNDLYQLYKITESELNLGKADIGLVEWGTPRKLSCGSIFFKAGAEDIFRLIKEIMYKYRVNEQIALNAVCTNNLLWATSSPRDAGERFVPLDLEGAENIPQRVKKLNVRYDSETDSIRWNYPLATKPIKVAHFHFKSDLSLDSAMYGKNSLKKVLLPERLIKIFHRHQVKGTHPKKMKNLMVYSNSEKKFSERLLKAQIDNSLKMGWKKEDIVLIENKDQVSVAGTIAQLLNDGVVKEAELWWYHDLDVFQTKPLDSSQIDLLDTVAGFSDNEAGKLDTQSIFFRIDSERIFGWIRNRARRLRSDEATALESLVAENYRDINSRYIKLSPKPTLFAHKQI
jgi:hypothetical protein